MNQPLRAEAARTTRSSAGRRPVVASHCRFRSVAQLAIAWVLAQSEDIVPLVGARRRDRLEEALGAVDVELDDEALATIERAVPKGTAAGERYDARQMAILDSERS